MAPSNPTRHFFSQNRYATNGVSGQISEGNYNRNYTNYGASTNASNHYPTNTRVYGNSHNSWIPPNASNQSHNYSGSPPSQYSYPQQRTAAGQPAGYGQTSASYGPQPNCSQQVNHSQQPNYFGQQGNFPQQGKAGPPANYIQQSKYAPPVKYGQNNVNSTYPTTYSQQASTAAAQLPQPSMDYSQWGNSQYGNQQYYGSNQQPQYQPTPPQIRNPFAPPPPARTQYTGQNSSHDPEYEAQLAQWQSAYAPADPYERGKKGGKDGKGENPNLTNLGVRQGPAQGVETSDANAKSVTDEKKKTVVRKGGGETWEDDTLLEWDPTQFRIMVGNLAGEVTDDSLFKAFASYGPSKARVVRDKRTTKSKGFGFVAFTDGEMGFKAAREMTGKYIGSHPVTIQRSKTDVRAVAKKDKNKGKNKNKEKKQDDPLHAHTGAHIEKKPVRNPAGYKILG